MGNRVNEKNASFTDLKVINLNNFLYFNKH